MNALLLTHFCLDRANQPAWTALRDKYEAQAKAIGDDAADMTRFEANYAKYFDLENWLKYHARHALALRLHEGKPGRRVVDIGCGAGIFPFVCRCLGHDAAGFDIESNMYQEMAAILEVPYRVQRVQAFTPLPDVYDGIDIFSAIATKFDRMDFADRTAVTWGVDAWAYLFGDLAARMPKDGVVYLKPNKHTDEQFFENPEVGAYLFKLANKVTPSMEFQIPVENLPKAQTAI